MSIFVRRGRFCIVSPRRRLRDGMIYRRYVAEREDCLGCELRARCLMGKTVRRRQL